MNQKKVQLSVGKNSHERKVTTNVGSFRRVKKSNDREVQRILCEWSKGRRWLAQRANCEGCSEVAFARCASDAPVRVVWVGYSAEATARTRRFVGFYWAGVVSGGIKPLQTEARSDTQGEQKWKGLFCFLADVMESAGKKNKIEAPSEEEKVKAKNMTKRVSLCALWHVFLPPLRTNTYFPYTISITWAGTLFISTKMIIIVSYYVVSRVLGGNSFLS